MMMEASNSVSKRNSGSIAAVFPGQGSQFAGMGKQFYDQFPVAREVFEEASEAIHVDLRKLCFNGTESELALTENTQPCLLATSVAAFKVAERELGFAPAVVAGHSLGEYSALVAIGCLELAPATQWVRARGMAMQQAVPLGEGRMAAVIGLEDQQVNTLCELATGKALENRKRPGISEISVQAIVEPVNFNAPGQVVIAGSSDAVEEAITLLKSDPQFGKGKAIPLQVSAPFHSRLMKPAADRMKALFSEINPQCQPKLLKCAYVPNLTGRMTREHELVFEFLVQQVDHPVLWKQSVSALLDNHFSPFIEFGPGKVLAGLIKRISTAAGKSAQIQSVSDPSALKNLESFL